MCKTHIEHMVSAIFSKLALKIVRVHLFLRLSKLNLEAVQNIYRMYFLDRQGVVKHDIKLLNT